MKKNHNNNQVFRAAIDATFEIAEASEAAFRIRGIANTFSVMRSGRMLHPSAFDAYFQRRGKAAGPFFSLLANHGAEDGFATIGRVDSLQVTKRGLEFSATLASGTRLADEARQLIAQRMISGLSLGWRSLRDRSVSLDDRDVQQDDELREAMEAAGVKQAWVFYEAEPVEISLVDVPDDANARIAARGGRGGADGLAQLSADLRDDLKQAIDKLVDAAREELAIAHADPGGRYAAYWLNGEIDGEEVDVEADGEMRRTHCKHGRANAFGDDDDEPIAMRGAPSDQLTRVARLFGGEGVRP